MKKKVKLIAIGLCSLLFISGFFFLDENMNYQTIGSEDDKENVNEKDTIKLSLYEEAASYKLATLHEAVAMKKGKKVRDYLEPHFTGFLIDQLVGHFEHENSSHSEELIEDYLSFDRTQLPTLISVSGEQVVLLWPHEEAESLYVTLVRENQFWKISKIELSLMNLLKQKQISNLNIKGVLNR